VKPTYVFFEEFDSVRGFETLFKMAAFPVARLVEKMAEDKTRIWP
jgi:hypothetical protein